jgi:hypothetical protein
MINKILDISALLTIVVTSVVVIRLSTQKRRLEKIINAIDCRRELPEIETHKIKNIKLKISLPVSMKSYTKEILRHKIADKICDELYDNAKIVVTRNNELTNLNDYYISISLINDGK